MNQMNLENWMLGLDCGGGLSSSGLLRTFAPPLQNMVVTPKAVIFGLLRLRKLHTALKQTIVQFHYLCLNKAKRQSESRINQKVSILLAVAAGANKMILHINKKSQTARPVRGRTRAEDETPHIESDGDFELK